MFPKKYAPEHRHLMYIEKLLKINFFYIIRILYINGPKVFSAINNNYISQKN